LSAGDLVRVTSKRGELLLPLVVSNEVGSGMVFAAMHWSGQFLASGGINEVSTGAVDPKSFQPELKHAAVRVEKATFGWNLLAARRGDALALQSAVQPLLRECAFASLSLRADADPASEQAWLVVRAAADSAPPQWVQRLADGLQLQPGEHVLEYHDARRGLLKRVGWGRDAHNDRIEGLLLSGGARDSASDALLDIALAGTAWTGSRLAVFTQRLPGGARDALVCQCMQVRESSIRAAITRGADVEQLKKQLGCGSVCGSCVPQLVRMRREIVDSG
jgi:assimilatory nitrate reductase catalytic subunit